MLILIFILPLIIALACMALSQRVPTRWLGVLSAAAQLICAIVLLVTRLRGDVPLILINHPWIVLNERPFAITLAFDAANWAFALLVYAAGSLALLLLALAVPLNVRGFGGLFTAALLAQNAVIAGLANQNAALLPFYWAIATILIFLALRASGAISGVDAPLLVFLAGLCSALLLLGITLAWQVDTSVPLWALLVGWTVIGLIMLGAPPFHTAMQAFDEAPAALTGALLVPGLPLLGGYALIRYGLFTTPGALPAGWQLALTLVGLATTLICAAGALGTTRLRQLLAWQLSAQLGFVLLAVGQGGAAISSAAPALLANTMLGFITCYLAIAIIEQHAGSDDMTTIDLRQPLIIPGVVFLLGAASILGLPGSWGMWAHCWLFDQLMSSRPWVVPGLLAGTSLLALAFIAPIALFWRQSNTPSTTASPHRNVSRIELTILIICVAPLVILGSVPQFAWRGWLNDFPAVVLPSATVTAPSLPDGFGQVACAIAALLLILILPLALRAKRQRNAPLDAQPRLIGVIAPSAIGESLHGLAWLAMPDVAFNTIWNGLLWLSRGVRRGLALFEQRYYLAGLLIAVILVIMLFIQ